MILVCTVYVYIGHSMADTLTVALRVAEEAIEEAIAKAESYRDSLVRNYFIYHPSKTNSIAYVYVCLFFCTDVQNVNLFLFIFNIVDYMAGETE